MDNPYRIEPPFSISFSGGRTSGYLLYKILEAYDGKLPDETAIVFANTGKEFPETLDFVHACETRWQVPIQWVEFMQAPTARQSWKHVNFETADRTGKPFSDLLDAKQYLPNPVARICTARIIQDHPASADWWIQQEARARASKPDGVHFRRDRNYAAFKASRISWQLTDPCQQRFGRMPLP